MNSGSNFDQVLAFDVRAGDYSTTTSGDHYLARTGSCIDHVRSEPYRREGGLEWPYWLKLSEVIADVSLAGPSSYSLVAYALSNSALFQKRSIEWRLSDSAMSNKSPVEHVDSMRAEPFLVDSSWKLLGFELVDLGLNCAQWAFEQNWLKEVRIELSSNGLLANWHNAQHLAQMANLYLKGRQTEIFPLAIYLIDRRNIVV